ncbi:DoxX family protein [Novosphingobium sp. SL115]|uniref:DoxX family protein n=1 Tax=Novosphingobium sp. SL115 TaxID=2995150 RepID=UPI002276BDA6|nr:DoxX family protein [Novosphingobium sp. SL115]MCY1672202.1 DoxX family protein [Novosphingobium sp. SL115]
MPQNRLATAAQIVLLAPLSLILAAFHGFVGWHKAFAPLNELARHTAWTVHLPEALGRTIGWMEIGLALVLIAALIGHFKRPALARAGMWAAVVFVVLEVISSWVHYRHGEVFMLKQNAVSVGMTALVAWLYRSRSAKSRVSKKLAHTLTATGRSRNGGRALCKDE